MSGTPVLQTPVPFNDCHTPFSKRNKLSSNFSNSEMYSPKAFVNSINDETLQENTPNVINHNTNTRRAGVEKRRSLALQASPKLPRTPGAEDAGNSVKLTNDQLANHYKNCMKLSTENKITSKNAFNLHLIDHMDEMLKERYSGSTLNFMEAGGTIYAGAKIYASRVDAVYTEAYRVLNSLGMHTGEQGNSDDETPKDNENGPVTSKRRKKRSMVLESNRNNLCSKVVETKALVELLNIADISSSEGQFINNIFKTTDGVTLLFHSLAKSIWDRNLCSYKESLSPEKEMDDNTEKTENIENGNVQNECGALFCRALGAKTDHSIPPISFDWTADTTDLSEDIQNNSPLNSSNVNDVTSSQPLNSNDFEMGDDNIDDFPALEDDDIPDVNSQGDQGHSMPNVNDNILNYTIGAGADQLADVTMNEYSYFKSSALRLGDGPSHWKLKSKKKIDPSVAQPETSEKTKSKSGKRKVFLLDFGGNCNCDKFPTLKKDTLKTKEAKEKQKKTAEDKLCRFARRDEIKDTMRCHTISNLTIKPFNSKLKQSAAVETENYNYDNVNDANNFCPADDMCDETAAGFDLGATMFDATSFPDFSQATTQQTNYMDMLKSDENLISQPKKVQQIDIAYAKKAKRVDVKKLKSAMWKCIEVDKEPKTPKRTEEKQSETEGETTTATETETEDDSKDANSTKDKPVELHVDSFTELYNTIPQLLPSKMNESLSIPLAFTCLLHLANEKKLKLIGNEDMTDVSICIDPDL